MIVSSNTKLVKENIEETGYIEQHVHRRSRTFGKSADQSGNNWGIEDRLTPFRAISGNDDYGSDENDEAKVIGSDDSPIISGQMLFDPGFIQVVGASNDTVFIIRVAWGTGTLANAILAGQYSSIPSRFDSANPQLTAFLLREIGTPKLPNGTKIWVQAKNATDNAWIDFYMTAHGY